MIFRSDFDVQTEGAPTSPTRNAFQRAAFDRHKAAVLADPAATALAKVRVTAFGHGFTREELAERAGVSVSTIAKAEDGRGRAVGDDVWAALAGALTEANGRNLNRRYVIGTYRTICPTALYA